VFLSCFCPCRWLCAYPGEASRKDAKFRKEEFFLALLCPSVRFSHEDYRLRETPPSRPYSRETRIGVFARATLVKPIKRFLLNPSNYWYMLGATRCCEMVTARRNMRRGEREFMPDQQQMRRRPPRPRRFNGRAESIRRAAMLGGVLLSFALIIHGVFGANGLLTMRQKRREYSALRQQLQQLKSQNKQLQQQVQGLKSDPDTIGRYAREELHMARPGEVIYVLPPQARQNREGTALNSRPRQPQSEPRTTGPTAQDRSQ
jgi:cell division protein FtsB